MTIIDNEISAPSPLLTNSVNLNFKGKKKKKKNIRESKILILPNFLFTFLPMLFRIHFYTIFSFECVIFIIKLLSLTFNPFLTQIYFLIYLF